MTVIWRKGIVDILRGDTRLAFVHCFRGGELLLNGEFRDLNDTVKNLIMSEEMELE